MSDTWVPAPRKMPYRCRRTGLDGVADGPYFEESLAYSETAGDDRELTLYHSVQWIRHICSQPGSPLTVLEPDEVAEIESLREEAADLAATVEELRAELERAKSVETLIDTERLVTSMERYFESKAAAKAPAPRKPKAAA